MGDISREAMLAELKAVKRLSENYDIEADKQILEQEDKFNPNVELE